MADIFERYAGRHITTRDIPLGAKHLDELSKWAGSSTCYIGKQQVEYFSNLNEYDESYLDLLTPQARERYEYFQQNRLFTFADYTSTKNSNLKRKDTKGN